MKAIDLNGDLGESFGSYRLGMDAELLPLLSSANVACGFHAGDPQVMDRTVALAAAAGTAVGAHPGYPDLVGFGRRSMGVSPAELGPMVRYQLGALDAFCRGRGIRLQHVKPHGAMYNQAAADMKLARAIAEAIAAYDDKLILLGLSGSCLIDAGREKGLRTAGEVFADRAYEDDGSLVARSKPGAVITDEDEAVARTVRMAAEGVVTTITGKELRVRADSVCLHGDNPHAVAFAARIRQALAEAGVAVLPLHKLAL